MSLTISNSQYNTFLRETFFSTADADGLRLFIAKSAGDKETDIKAWATSKKASLESQKTAYASTAVTVDANFTTQIAEMDSIINS